MACVGGLRARATDLPVEGAVHTTTTYCIELDPKCISHHIKMYFTHVVLETLHLGYHWIACAEASAETQLRQSTRSSTTAN